MSDPREIELKLELAPSDAEALKRRGPLTAGGTEPTRERLTAVYFDTKAHALRERGLSLRVRSHGDRQVQTVKQGGGSGVGLFDRLEWEADIEGAGPDLDLAGRTPVGKVLRQDGSDLQAVFETRIDRTTWAVEANGSAFAVALDEGEVVADGASRPIAELELELTRGSPADLFKFARTLGVTKPPRIGVLSKSERGYALASGERDIAVKAGPVPLTRGISTGDAFQAIARACLRHFRLNEPRLLATRLPESLHQARVALRRFRSALSIFGPVIADGTVVDLTARLKDLTGPFGHARNLDVYIARAIRPEAERDASIPGVSDYLSLIEADRARAYDEMVATLESEEYRLLMLDLLEWVEAGPWLANDAPEAAKLRDLPVESFAADVLDRYRRKLKKKGSGLDGLDPGARHKVRIEAKKLRYAAEFFSGLAEGKRERKRVRLFLSALEDLQGHLGDLNDIQVGHDIAVAAAHHAAAERDSRPDLYLFAAGRVSEAGDERVPDLLEEAATAHRALVDAKRFWKAWAAE